MPRAPVGREPCDCLDCVDRPYQPPASVQTAIARQEPPPKSVLIYLHSAVSAEQALQLGSFDLPHVAALVRDGCSGLLAFRQHSAAGSSADDHGNVDIGSTVRDLLGVKAAGPAETLGQRLKGLQAAAFSNSPALEEICASCGIDRCEGVNSPSDQLEPELKQVSWPGAHKLAQRIARRLGVPFFQLSPPPDALPPGLAALDAPMPGGGSTPDHKEPGVATTNAEATGTSLETASGAAGALATASTEDEDDGDMLLLLLDCSPPPPAAQGSQNHYHQHQPPPQQQLLQPTGPPTEGPAPTAAGSECSTSQLAAAEPTGGSPSALEWLDSFLRALNQVEGFRDTVLLSVVLGLEPVAAAAIMARLEQREGQLLGQQGVPQGQQGGHQAEQGQLGGGARWSFCRPLQSYQFRGTEQVAVRQDLAALVVHRLAGVIRKDAIQKLDVGEVLERGGGGCILAERLVPEVAYKLGRAPKYGA